MTLLLKEFFMDVAFFLSFSPFQAYTKKNPTVYWKRSTKQTKTL